VALAKLLPGISIKEIVTSAHEVVRREGYQIIGHVGHSIGLCVEELPRLEISPRTDPDLKLEKDMMFAFFQGSLQRGKGTGIRLEDTVLIGESGPQILTNYTREIQCY
jgi:Xaa-Pro aminopeptidase